MSLAWGEKKKITQGASGNLLLVREKAPEVPRWRAARNSGRVCMEVPSGCFTGHRDSAVAFLLLRQHFAVISSSHALAVKEPNSLRRAPAARGAGAARVCSAGTRACFHRELRQPVVCKGVTANVNKPSVSERPGACPALLLKP